MKNVVPASVEIQKSSSWNQDLSEKITFIKLTSKSYRTYN